MPNYAQYDDLKKRVEESTLILWTNDGGDDFVVSSVCEAALEDSEALINSFVEGYYLTPLSPISERIKQITIDIALYRIAGRRGLSNIPDQIEEYYREAISYLTMIQEGKVKLFGVTAATSKKVIIGVSKDSNNRKFTEDSTS